MRELKIAYGNSRNQKKWSNKTASWEGYLLSRIETPTVTTESTAEYAKMSKAERDQIKDRGGFVAGHLRDNRRLVDHVVCRSMLVYDMDFITYEYLKQMSFPVCSAWYTTHSHTPEHPRARLIIPLSRDVTPDEFVAVARLEAEILGILTMIDPCSFRLNQLMYWPTVSSDGEFLSGHCDGPLLDPDEILSDFPYWKDLSLLPTTPKESIIQKQVSKQADPLEKSGVVGAFNRTYYPIQTVIETFLSDVYAASTVTGRYDFIAGESTAGVVIYEDKFAYSHHATDPASGKLCNAFDLVRLHKFGDTHASFSEMTSLAIADPKVKIQLAKEKQKEAQADFSEDWQEALAYSKKGDLINDIRNLRLILEHDENLQGIVFNQLADSMEIVGEVPWNHPAKFWRDADDAQLICYIEEQYGTFSQRNYLNAVAKVADDRSYHPIKDYFESLPEWDGVPRAELYFIEYLGAEDNAYTRAATRKLLCAAYRRIYEPGVKFDYCLVLVGPQGIGKSTAIAKLGMEWYSDSLALSDMNDKTAAEKLQGYWILEIGELAGMRKAETDKTKAFLSRQDDKYRASFGRRVTPHPRQCVFIGTTNAENGYLRDVTGNRRFWNLRVTGDCERHPWNITQHDIDQLWAEVKTIAPEEPLYLSHEVEAYAKKEQNAAVETDEREGLVAAYLETLLPKNWEEMDLYERRTYLSEISDPMQPKGTEKRQTVSNMEIWCECFGQSKDSLKPFDSYAIAAIMMHFEDWEKTNQRVTSKIYGRQRIYQRKA